MRVILVKDKVFIKDIYGALLAEDCEVDLDVSYIKDNHLYTFEYAFNDDEQFQKSKDNKIVLPAFKQDRDYVIIKVRATNLATGAELLFSSDPLDVSNYYYLGKPLEQVHPNVLAGMLHRIQELEKRVSAVETEGDIL